MNLKKSFLLCEERGINARVAINFFPHMIAKVCLEEIEGIPLLTFNTVPHDEFVLALKRGFDILVSSAVHSPLCAFFSSDIPRHHKRPLQGPYFLNRLGYP